ncbi:MAG: hypothetical protein RLZ25_1300, partial [Pseudomonadota bacterium]
MRKLNDSEAIIQSRSEGAAVEIRPNVAVRIADTRDRSGIEVLGTAVIG